MKQLLSRKRQYVRSTNGFTVVEIIVVIGIIGILITVFMQVYNPVTHIQKDNDIQRSEDLVTIQKALQIYYQDYHHYPQHEPETYLIKMKPTDPGAEWGFNGFAPYMQVLPKDPGKYKYVYVSDGDQMYQLYGHLEQAQDNIHTCFPEDPSTPCAGAQRAGVSMKCGGVCNFGVSSPNISP